MGQNVKFDYQNLRVDEIDVLKLSICILHVYFCYLVNL